MARTSWAVAVVLVACGTAWAVFPPPVKDDGKFFKPAGLEAANKKIRELYEKYKKDVVVETLASLTEEQDKALKSDGRGKFFGKLALDRTRVLGVNGIYVLIVKKPQYLQIFMDPATAKKAFTNTDRGRMRDQMFAKFKEDDFDGGLQAGLEVIEASLKKNTTPSK
jgi:uncharacterized membrane protein YgcG